MSKYPNKIDNSSSLPIVRNNIIEAGSDAINNIRNAVINIERALGINPQGSLPSLSERINKSIDDSGNIKSSAIANLNLISGPIKNSDVSENANISEHKLDLSFSTEYLQSEISIIMSKIDYISAQVSNIKSALVVHENSLDAHIARSISVESISDSERNTANVKSSADLQIFLNSFINSHINFASDASASNRSHTASQIFVENQNIDGVSSSDLQNAIEELSVRDSGSLENILHNYKNSHFPKASVVGDRYLRDEEIYDLKRISYSSYSPHDGRSGTEVYPLVLEALSIKSGDFCVISEVKYEIESVTLDSSGFVVSLFLENFFPSAASANKEVSFVKKIKDQSSEVGLISVPMKDPDTLKKKYTQMINPESAYCIASETPNFSNFVFPGSGGEISINVGDFEYSIRYSETAGTLGELVDDLNVYCIKNNIPVLFGEFESKLVASSMIIGPEFFIKINSENKDLGFISTEEFYPMDKRRILIGRKEFTSISKTLDSAQVSVSAGKIISDSVNFISSGVKVNSSIIIEGKRFVVSDVRPFELSVLSGVLPSGSHTITTYSDTMSVGFIDGESYFGSSFEGAGVLGYLNSSCSFSAFRYLDFNVPFDASGSPLIFPNIKNETLQDEEFEIEIFYNPNDENIYVRSGDSSVIFSDGKFTYFGKNTLSLTALDIESLKSVLKNDSFGRYICQFRVKSFSLKDNLKICDMYVNKSAANIYDHASYPERGYVRSENISNSLNETQDYERSLIHSSRVLEGLSVELPVSSSSGFYTVNVSGGKVLFDGDIVSIERTTINSSVSISNNSVYVYIDRFGNLGLIASISSPNCAFPLDLKRFIPIALIENFSSSFYIYNLTNYHSSFDDFTIGNIFVDPSSGNVKTIGEAIKLARKYFDAFGSYPGKIILSPTSHFANVEYDYQSAIDLEGSDYTNAAWDSGIYIDFPISIEGSGPRSEIICSVSDIYGESEFFRSADIILNFGTDNEVSRPATSFCSGNITFKDLKIKNTGVQVKNLDIVDATTQNLSGSSVLFENVIFEFEDNSDSISGRVIFNNKNDLSVKTGSLSVSNCIFVNYNIVFDQIDPRYLFNLKILNNAFGPGYISDSFIRHSSSGTVSFSSEFDGFKYSNIFEGNILSDQSSALQISTGLFWSDFSCETKNFGYGIFNSNLQSNVITNLYGTSNILSESTNFKFSNMVFEPNLISNPIEFLSRGTDQYVMNVEGPIRGLQRVRFCNEFAMQVNSGTFQYYMFNFASLVPSLDGVNERLKDHKIRLNPSDSETDSLFIKNISISFNEVMENEDFSFIFHLGSANVGSRAISDLVGAPVPSGEKASSFLSVSPSDKFSSKYLDIDSMISSPLSSLNSRTFNDKSLVLTFGVKSDIASFIDAEFSIFVDVEIK